MAAPLPVDIAHIALTVSDLDRSVEWYSNLFGERPFHVGEMLAGTSHHYALAVWLKPNFALHHFAGGGDRRFDERQPGLDHVAFTCASREELVAWAGHLDRLGIERGEILDEPYGHGLAFRDPDNIALELFAPRPRPSTEEVPPDQT